MVVITREVGPSLHGPVAVTVGLVKGDTTPHTGTKLSLAVEHQRAGALPGHNNALANKSLQFGKRELLHSV